MAEKYEEKRVYYIPAFVERIEALGNYPVKVTFDIGEERCAVQFENLPDLMFTAEEVVKENDLDTLLRDEVVKENKKLKAKVKTAEEAVGTLKTKADAMTVTADSLREENEELRAKLAEFKETIGKQSDKLRELQARIVELNEVNSSLGENRDALNNEAAVHMTSIHNLQVAVEVLAEKIFEMRCEQDG